MKNERRYKVGWNPSTNEFSLIGGKYPHILGEYTPSGEHYDDISLLDELIAMRRQELASKRKPVAQASVSL